MWVLCVHTCLYERQWCIRVSDPENPRGKKNNDYYEQYDITTLHVLNIFRFPHHWSAKQIVIQTEIKEKTDRHRKQRRLIWILHLYFQTNHRRSKLSHDWQHVASHLSRRGVMLHSRGRNWQDEVRAETEGEATMRDRTHTHEWTTTMRCVWENKLSDCMHNGNPVLLKAT